MQVIISTTVLTHIKPLRKTIKLLSS